MTALYRVRMRTGEHAWAELVTVAADAVDAVDRAELEIGGVLVDVEKIREK